MLRYIRDKKNLGLEYYSKIEDAPISDLLRPARIQTENQLMVFYNSIWHYCPDTGRSTVAYIVFYQCGPIDHCAHVLGPVPQSSEESEYNPTFTAGTDLEHFRMINTKLFNWDLDVVPKKLPLFILDTKSAIFMAKNSKDNKRTRKISRKMYLVRNGEE